MSNSRKNNYWKYVREMELQLLKKGWFIIHKKEINHISRKDLFQNTSN